MHEQALNSMLSSFEETFPNNPVDYLNVFKIIELQIGRKQTNIYTGITGQ